MLLSDKGEEISPSPVTIPSAAFSLPDTLEENTKRITHDIKGLVPDNSKDVNFLFQVYILLINDFKIYFIV